jgi:hypothetical protein
VHYLFKLRLTHGVRRLLEKAMGAASPPFSYRGYNPLKPGRPSHAYHSFMVGGVRLILDVAVEPGNRHSSKHSEPHLWDHLGRQPRPCWPALGRGDKDWGNQRNMCRCEQEGCTTCSSCA